MPVSKKPRRKSARKASPLPDRRAMESVLAEISGQRDDGAIARAQDVIYGAWEATTPRARIALARKALAISPLCADAFNLLAEEAKSPTEARELYTKALEAAELALGPEAFEEYAGHFWGFLETRPYMRAKAGLALTLLTLGEMDAAINHYREMLTLNPNDNQGIRYGLAACFLRKRDDAALKELLATYPNEASIYWAYTRALIAFREGGADDAQAAALAKEAWAENEHVPAILAGTKRPVLSSADYLTVGGPEEASSYCAEFGAAWHTTPSAVKWLTRITAGLARTRPAIQ